MVSIREKSILKLSRNDQFELMKLNVLIASKMTDYECAQYFRKKRTDENGNGRGIYEIAAELEIGKFREYVKSYEKAFSLFLSDKDESIELSQQELKEVDADFGELFASLNRNKPFIAEFFNSGKSFKTGNDRDVCRIGNSILSLLISGDINKARKRTTAYIGGKLF